MSHAIGLQDILDAKCRIESVVHCTPMHTSETLNRMAGSNQVFFKV